MKQYAKIFKTYNELLEFKRTNKNQIIKTNILFDNYGNRKKKKLYQLILVK